MVGRYASVAEQRDFEEYFMPRLKQVADKFYSEYDCNKHGIELEDLEQQLYLYCLELINDAKYSDVYGSVIVNVARRKLKTYIENTINALNSYPKTSVDKLVCSDWEENLFMQLEVKEILTTLYNKKYLYHDYQSRNDRLVILVMEYFGFFGEPCSIGEIARDYNLSKSRIRQLRDKVLRKMRWMLHSKYGYRYFEEWHM